MAIKKGRYGQFLACVSPTCKYKRTTDGDSGDLFDINDYLLSLPGEDVSQRLLELLEYLRNTHNYCFYCGAIYDDFEQLSKMCPGLYDSDH